MAINIENPNEFVNKDIMKRNLLWHHNLPLDDIGKAMDEARAEGYREGYAEGREKGQEYVKTRIFAELDKLITIELLRKWGKGQKMKQYGLIWAENYHAIKKKYGVD